MGTTKTTIAITVGLLLLVFAVVFAFKKKHGSELEPDPLNIEKTWKLPDELNEISGMVFLDENRLACIQDEDGIIFIYNLNTKKIEDQIEFAGSGDYEGIALVNTSIYVVQGNGTLLRIENFHRDPKVTEYETFLKSKNDVESLFFSNSRNELLVAVKERDPNSENYKGIYSFNLSTMELEREPVITIDMNDQIFERLEEKNSRARFKPSDLAIHPNTGDIFSVEGSNPKFMIMNAQGKPKKLLVLHTENFPQPEGIAFDPTGGLYISTEGNPAYIHKVNYEAH